MVVHLGDRGSAIGNVDATVVLERPKLAPYRDAIRASLADALGLPESAVNVKATRASGWGSSAAAKAPPRWRSPPSRGGDVRGRNGVAWGHGHHREGPHPRIRGERPRATRTAPRIGTIDEIYLDADSGEPEWALVTTGLFGNKRTFGPAREATEEDGS